jgi:beta-glucosidase
MQTGWEVYPEALGHTVRLAAEHAGVTENGIATDDDAARVAYTRAA